MPEALALVKRELGADAVILGTRSAVRGGLGRREQVEITAAASHAAPVSPPGEGSESPWRGLVERLVTNDVAEALADRLVREAVRRARESGRPSPAAVHLALREQIALLAPSVEAPFSPSNRPIRMAIVGPPGVGKTTTIAKLATQLHVREKRRVAIVSLDGCRLAAHAHIRRYAEIIGIPLFTAQTVDASGKLRARLAEFEVVLIDTPGVGLRDEPRFAEVAALLAGIRPDRIQVAVRASVEPRAQEAAVRRFRRLGDVELVLTHVDEAIGLGVVLNAIDRLDCRVSFVTTGQRIATDFEPLCGRRLAQRLLAESAAQAPIATYSDNAAPGGTASCAGGLQKGAGAGADRRIREVI